GHFSLAGFPLREVDVDKHEFILDELVKLRAKECLPGQLDAPAAPIRGVKENEDIFLILRRYLLGLFQVLKPPVECVGLGSLGNDQRRRSVIRAPRPDSAEPNVGWCGISNVQKEDQVGWLVALVRRFAYKLTIDEDAQFSGEALQAH